MSLPSDPLQRKAIKKVLDELSGSMTRIEGERDYIKETINKICEELERLQRITSLKKCMN